MIGALFPKGFTLPPLQPTGERLVQAALRMQRQRLAVVLGVLVAGAGAVTSALVWSGRRA